MFRKLLDEAQAGDNIGALLRGVQRNEIERGHNVPCGTQYILNKDVILINDYSMIVATRPDPTVRPPSRI